MSSSIATLGLILIFAATTPAHAQQPAKPHPGIDLLQSRCIKCHNSEKRAGGIDFSTRATAMASSAIKLADPASSRIVQVIVSGKMPPNGRLPVAEADTLKAWIKTGAPYPDKSLIAVDPGVSVATKPLWSFQPVHKPAIPASPFDKLSSNPLDRFIFAKLAKEGLRPSPLSGKLALLKRVTVDLTGLPPTPEEARAFMADKSPNAYEKVVDRLLASSAYGERWGRNWLDVVRYGESMGYEQNHLRANAWPYRDWVIASMNEDKPYDKFVQQQLAGDVLGKGDPSSEAGTGFLVAGIHDTVGIQEEVGSRQQRINDLEDIVSTTAAAFLGLTVGCARCHDHKFDPIPQKDFYRIAACFSGVQHGERQLKPLSEADKLRLETTGKDISAINDKINALDGLGRDRVLKSRGQPTTSRPAVNARRNVDEFEATSARYIRFTVLKTNDGAEPCIDELQVYSPGSDKNIALSANGARARSSSLLPGFAVHQVDHLNDGLFGNEKSWISNERGAGWAQIGLTQPAMIHRVVWSRDGGDIPRFDDRIPVSYKIEVSLDGENWKTVSTEAGRAGTNDYVHPDAINASLTTDERSQRKALVTQRDDLGRQAGAIRASTSAYIGTFSAPQEIYLLRRGDVMQRIEPVTPGAFSDVKGVQTASFEKPMTTEADRRLALAKWITDPNNPLAPRVIVNRIWQGHFGRGIVGTPSDFGRNGELPSHPELLDWLASVFISYDEDCCSSMGGMDGMEMGGAPKPTAKPLKKPVVSSPITPVPGMQWKLKALHKLIATSYTYRQSSDATEAGMAKDAGNLYLWRAPLRRMEAEVVRDAILQTSGKLDRRMGGPSFRLFKYNVVNVAIYERLEEQGPETWRRSVYQQAARGIRDDLLGTLDCPESSQRAPKRESTTTALQALSLLNGKFVLDQAGFMTERVRKDAGSDTGKQVDRAFEIAFSRKPSLTERTSAAKLVASQGIEALCRALLNANEFLYY